MRWLLGALLITAGMAGCIATDTLDPTDRPGTDEAQAGNKTGGCNVDEASGTLAPGDPLTVTTDAGAAPAKASIFLGSEGAGEVELTLERGGQAVWNHSETSYGTYRYSTNVEDLDAGTYTLTASAMGARNGTLQLALEWGQTAC